jgi:hypothetical protein
MKPLSLGILECELTALSNPILSYLKHEPPQERLPRPPNPDFYLRHALLPSFRNPKSSQSPNSNDKIDTYIFTLINYPLRTRRHEDYTIPYLTSVGRPSHTRQTLHAIIQVS